MTARIEDTLSRALAYARHGWPVFPCRPGSKEPATGHGFCDATTDPDQIARWWHDQPRANLAIATGSPGPDVLDVDRHDPARSGFAAYDALKREGLLDGAAAIIATPRDGLHAYFTGSDQPSGRLPGHHLDFKACGGYVLAPPSQVRGNRLVACPAGSGRLDWAAAARLLEPERQHVAPPSAGVSAEPRRLTAWVESLPEATGTPDSSGLPAGLPSPDEPNCSTTSPPRPLRPDSPNVRSFAPLNRPNEPSAAQPR